MTKETIEQIKKLQNIIIFNPNPKPAPSRNASCSSCGSCG